MLLNKLYYVLVDVLSLRSYFVIKVRTVERTSELLGINHSEALLYVAAHLVGSRCGEGNNGRLSDFCYRWAYVAVFWAEIVSPLRDTVCLVYGIERNLYRFQKIDVLIFR